LHARRGQKKHLKTLEIKIRALLLIVCVTIGTPDCKSQENFDTLTFISNALQLSKLKLQDLIVKEKNRNTDVIFVKAESISQKTHLYKETEFDDLTIIYTSELSLFHFNVNSFLNIIEFRIRKRQATIIFNTRTNFNKIGTYNGAFYFKKKSGVWNFDRLKLKAATNKGDIIKAWE
jgi:hypothetical protein